MPLTKKGIKIKKAFVKHYGSEWEKYFYGAINSGKITGAEGSSKNDPKPKKNRKNSGRTAERSSKRATKSKKVR